MRLLLSIFLSSFYLISFGQKNSYERDSLGRLIANSPKYKFTESNHEDFYRHAQQLINSEEKDSLFEAYRVLRTLYYFDSSKYSRQIRDSFFNKIENINLTYNKKQIIGTWKFQWSGSNWGTTETSEAKDEKIIFTQNEASFYKEQKLFRKTEYYITNRFSTLLKEFIFQVYFLDDKSAKDISFRTKGADYIAKLKFDKNNVGLYLDAPVSCNDCGREIYLLEMQK